MALAECQHLDGNHRRMHRIAGKVHFGAVDATVHRSLAGRFNVNGYPTLYHIDGSSGQVRRVSVSAHTVDAFTEFAQHGWKRFAPINAKPLAAPAGPGALIKDLALKVVEKVTKFNEVLSNALGFPPIIVGFSLALAGIALASLGLMAFAVWLGPRDPAIRASRQMQEQQREQRRQQRQREREQGRPHRD